MDSSSNTSILGNPNVGLGTLGLKESAKDATASAIKFGCRLIDTGEHYGNLDSVGLSLKENIANGESTPCVIVKLSGMPTGEYEFVRKRMANILSILGIKRADICLMHWPGSCTWDPMDMEPLSSPSHFQDKASSWNDFCSNIGVAWNNMSQLKNDGYCSEIGTSNFYSHHIEELKKACKGAKPFANEIFIDISNPEIEFVQNMQEDGINVIAYRPVAYKPYPECVEVISNRLGKSTSCQSVILAWLLRRNIYPLVKCRNVHVEENMSVPNTIANKLTVDDMDKLNGCGVDIRFSPEWFAKIWMKHNVTTEVLEEDLQVLVAMGVDETRAREVLKKCAGNMDAAMDMAFA